MASCVIVHFSLLSLLEDTTAIFILKKYLPQTLGSVVYILFSLFDISESDPSPKGEFSRPQKQALIMDMTWKWFKMKGALEFVGN